MKKPTKTLTIAMWPQANGAWFQTTIEKRGRWYCWFTEAGAAASDSIDSIRQHAERLGGHIEKRSNARYDDEMRAYRASNALRTITGILR